MIIYFYNALLTLSLLFLCYNTVAHGGNVNIIDNDGDTPLHFAESGSMAQCLVELGADTTKRNHEGVLPIENAYVEEWHEVVEFLKREF